MIILQSSILQPRPMCVSSFQTFYGIGRIKAIKLNQFLLNHPLQIKFSKDFLTLINNVNGQSIFHKIPTQTYIRLFVSNQWFHKISIYCYQAYRLFQNLPTKGQRTKANACTPSRLNPYLSLKINISFYPVFEIAYKRRELIANSRFDELKAFDKAQEEKKRMKSTDEKHKRKSAKENFIKKTKLKK